VTDLCVQPSDIDTSSGDVLRNLATLPVAFSEIHVGDTFYVSFDTANADDTGLWNWSGDFYGTGGMPTIAWHGGTITVVPEPSTLVLLLVALAALSRRSKGVGSRY
jgi:hypothetical protein